jgi:hypothetical protein
MVTLRGITSWLELKTTRLFIEALKEKRSAMQELLLDFSSNVDDQMLDRRVTHASGAIRALTAILDREELNNLFDDSGMLDIDSQEDN